MLTAKRPPPHLLEDFYYQYHNERYVGFYQFLLPTLIIRDLDLIKNITVKDFETFPEHRTFVTEDVDPLFGRSLFAMKGGSRWQTMRATLSPTFTSRKLKGMFEFMLDCATQFTAHYEKQGELVEVEMKQAFTMYTNDIIASTVFGVNCNSFQNPDNEFRQMGREATDFSGIKNMKFMFHAIHPLLAKLLGKGIFSEKVSSFFRNLVQSALKMREERNIVRHDVLHLLTEARKQNEHNAIVTDDDITGNALLFFTAGFDTSSTMLSFTCHELAVNPDVQHKLVREINDTFQDSKISYELLLGMKYLEQVISESLRKWPPSMQTDRVCVRSYKLSETFTLEKGTNVWIPIFALHRDPRYHLDPLKFDPERFNDENKRKMVPYTYMPFGVGPRSCIGSRFALLQAKIILVEMLRAFEIVPVEKTQIPLQLSCHTFNPSAEKGFLLGLKRRKNL
ncbi:hypothetical protein RI129_010406 [Pyrocoelia pectoralis]|uniref:Cytochrome P450 n=1 Tax=Pyrocoelia pectoralis TaxID=417401 RepID=A0AAN7V948_9COLE